MFPTTTSSCDTFAAELNQFVKSNVNVFIDAAVSALIYTDLRVCRPYVCIAKQTIREFENQALTLH